MEREKIVEEMVAVMGEWAIENKMCWNSKHAESLSKTLIDNNIRKIPDGVVVLTKEELIKAMEEGYIYDTTRGNKINLIEMAREQARKEVVKEICDFAKSEIKRLGKETVTDSFGERPLLFYEAAGKLIRSIKEKEW